MKAGKVDLFSVLIFFFSSSFFFSFLFISFHFSSLLFSFYFYFFFFSKPTFTHKMYQKNPLKKEDEMSLTRGRRKKFYIPPSFSLSLSPPVYSSAMSANLIDEKDLRDAVHKLAKNDWVMVGYKNDTTMNLQKTGSGNDHLFSLSQSKAGLGFCSFLGWLQ